MRECKKNNENRTMHMYLQFLAPPWPNIHHESMISSVLFQEPSRNPVNKQQGLYKRLKQAPEKNIRLPVQ